jgi:uncharacterized protein (TIGR03437 family)
LTFNYQIGSTGPNAQAISVSSTGGQLNWSATTSNPAWLQVSPTSGAATTSPTPVYISVTPSGLTPNTYSGSVTFSAAGTANGPQTIGITLVVTNASTPATLAVTGGPLSFAYQIGANAPVPQNLSVSLSSGTGVFTLSTNVAWLQVSPISGTLSTVQTSLTVSVIVTGLTPNTYSGTVSVSVPGLSGSPQVVNVTLTVRTNASSLPIFTTSVPASDCTAPTPGTVFDASVQRIYAWVSLAGGRIGDQVIMDWYDGSQINQAHSVNTLTFNGSGCAWSWITVAGTPNASDPGIWHVDYSYNGSFINRGSFQLQGAATPNTSSLVITGGPLTFMYQSGGSAPAQQTFTVSSSSAQLNITVTPSASWVSLAPSGSLTTPVSIAVTVAPAGLGAGTYTSLITISAPGASITLQTIMVTLVITASPLTSQQSYPIFYAGPVFKDCTVPTPVTKFSTNVPYVYAWIPIIDGHRMDYVEVDWYDQANHLAIAYNFFLGFDGPGCVKSYEIIAAPYNITSPVGTWSTVFKLNGAVAYSNTFDVVQSQNTRDTFQVTGQVLTGSGQPLDSVVLSFENGYFTTITDKNGHYTMLLPVDYSGSITPALDGYTFSPSSRSYLTITSDIGSQDYTANVVGATIQVSPASLSFTYRVGDPSPTNQQVTVTSSSGGLGFNVTSTSSGGNWLVAVPKAAVTPATISVGVMPQGLASGTYSGTVSIVGLGAVNSPVLVPVNITVVPQPISNSAPVITAEGIVNAASFGGGSLAPGEIVTIFGQRLGPPSIATLTLTSAGKVSTSLSGVRVLFDGIPAPLIYVTSGQCSAVVPYEVAGKTQTSVQLEYQGIQSPAVSVGITDAAPGVFTSDASGSGQAAALNQDGSINSRSNPASKGSVITLFVTGEGQTSPAGEDGLVVSAASLRYPLDQVTAYIAGIQAQVAYAGSAPGLIAGVMQVNVVVPTSILAGSSIVQVVVGQHVSPKTIVNIE